MDCDVLIVGGGAAACTVAHRLSGLDVILVTSGTSATAMSTGRIHVTGEKHPEVAEFIRSAGKEYGLNVKEGEVTSWTNRGTPYRQSFTSLYDCSGTAEAVTGIKGNKDLNPELFSKIAKGIVPYWINNSDEDSLISSIKEIPHDSILIPPLFGVKNYAGAMKKLEKECGRNLRETATPLSLPGKRFSEALLKTAEKSGAKILNNRRITGISSGRAEVVSGIREDAITYSSLILATGNLITGGLALDGNLVREPLVGIDVIETNNTSLNSKQLSDVLSSGIPSKARPGLYGCGAVTAGISYPLGRGLWDVICDAWNVAGTVKEEL